MGLSVKSRNKYVILSLSIAFIIILIVNTTSLFSSNKNPKKNKNNLNESQKKKILYVDSYHLGYEWSDGVTIGIKSVLLKRKDIDLKIVRMDTKRNKSERFKKNAGKKVKKIIENWKPDIVIASDDNASKYLIVPYFKNKDLPFVFCGLNWNVDSYGFPFKNVTGMIEVDMFDKVIKTMKKFSEGNKIGVLTSNTFSERKNVESIKKAFDIKFDKVVHADSFKKWKMEYLKLQNEVDMLILINYAGIKDFNLGEAKNFVENNTIIPTGSTMKIMIPFSLVSYFKIPEEQGEWAAMKALDVLDGRKISDISIEYNKKVEINLNTKLAKKLNIKFSDELIRISTKSIEDELYSHKEIAKKNYRGKVLNILTHEVPIMGEPTITHATEFEELTGIKINITHAPFGELYQEALLGLKNSKYDIVFFGSLWLADIFKYLEPVPHKLLNSRTFRDIIPHYKENAKWGEVTYQVNIDGDRHYLQYRKDLIENPIYMKKFKEKYGVKLSVPKTWKDFNRVAKFFNKMKMKNGKTIYGISEVTAKNEPLFSQFIKRAASYAKHPDVKGGFYFDLKTMKPLINSPGFVEALKDFVISQDYYPPGGKIFSLSDVVKSFGSGDSVLSDCWDDPFIKAMESTSSIFNKVGASLSPGSKRVWNRNTNKWDNFPKVNHVPYFAWGWTSGVSKNSKNKEAAFDFLGFFANDKNHFSDLVIGRFGINPYRLSDLNYLFWKEKTNWDSSIINSYLDTIENMIKSKNRVTDLLIYENRQYMKVLSVGVFRALTKRDTPQKALDEVARRWDIITDRIGRDKQRKAYLNTVKFENEIYDVE